MYDANTKPQPPKEGQVYTAIIIAVYNQEQERTADKKGWNRYRVIIDIADGESKGYYTYNYNDFERRQYLGVLDWYLPSEDYDEGKYRSIERRLEQQATVDKIKDAGISYAAYGVIPVSSEDKAYYYSNKQTIDNIATILKYNSLDSLPSDWKGLLIPIRLKIKDGVMPTIDGWLPSVTTPAPATADTDLLHYINCEDIDAVINKASCPKLTDILHAEKVKGRDIKIAPKDYLDDFLAKKAAAKKSTLKIPSHTQQKPSISPLIADPTPSSSLAPEVCEADIEALVEDIRKRQKGEVHNVDIDKLADDFGGMVDMRDELEREKWQTWTQKHINQAKARREQEFLEMFAPPTY